MAPPRRETIHGTIVDLEPLDPARHGDDLFVASIAEGAEERFAYLPEVPPTDRGEFTDWLTTVAASPDLLFFAVVDRATGRAVGRQALMRVDPANGVIEIGNILWGPDLARTRGATEAFFLFADAVFTSGYRRFEWKCNDANVPSKRAAERFASLPKGSSASTWSSRGATGTPHGSRSSTPNGRSCGRGSPHGRSGELRRGRSAEAQSARTPGTLSTDRRRVDTGHREPTGR